MENLYDNILNKYAKTQYNPLSQRKDFKTYDEMKEVYEKSNQNWAVYFKDIEKAVAVAIHETRRKDIEIIEDLKPKLDREKLRETAKNYFDAIEIVISKLKEVKEVRFYD